MRDFTFSMPPHVGIHRWLFSQVRIAQLKGFEAEYLRETFRPALTEMFLNGTLRREVTDRDLNEAIRNIFSTTSEAPRSPGPLSYDPVKGWCQQASTLKAVLNHDLVAAILKTPLKLPESRGHWHQLFKPTELLCVGYSASDYRVTRAGDLASHTRAQFIVPNPLRKALGVTKSGRLTSHCRDATGPRRFIVMENDHGMSVADQITILLWVSRESEVPLRLVVSSGGKSVHGWFDVAGASEDDIFEWVGNAVSVGFDPRLILPEQFVRFPDGYRPDKQAKQTILYTNVG